MASDRLQRQVERLLDEADQAIIEEDWSTVASRARAILRIDPENSDAISYLAVAERDQSTSTELPIFESSQPNTSTSPPTTTIPDQPTVFANDRYQVKRFLGEGGKKKVYLAQDTMLDREVAFALIKTEGLDDIGMTRVNREAQAMGRLGSHPHIVTVFDLGQEEGQPFMVTELMGGGDVEGLVEDSPENRVPMEQAMEIARAVCRGLEFAHSRGIVHRDLKPGNVWLTSDGIAKIGDFGLAVATDRSRLTTEGMMVGTVSYMPPEQAMGGEVTPRADLYSLGAMLYEMVTGRPPFLGDGAVAIIGQHINTPPVAPTWHNGACPKPLEAMILRLLTKDPAGRPESASDVLAALDAMDLSATDGAALEEDTSRSLDSVSNGVFVGRQREMDELKAALEDSLSGRGRMVTLVGEPGIGKTRTSQELATYAGLRSAQVLWGRCYEEQGVPPYWPWVQAIRSYVRERDPQELSAEMGAGASDIAGIVSDVRERLPGLPPSPELDPEQARFRLFDSISAFLKTASQRQPIILVLDDLHWADKPSLLLLQFVARELAGSRLLLVGTYRDMELSRQHPLAESLGELTRERTFQRVLLRGLTREDVGRFIEVATGIAPQEGLVAAVYTQTEGNPLFVTEVVRLLVQEGDLTADRAAGRESWTVRIPEGVREVIGRRLNRLSERCNETLTIASVVGREFRFEQLRGLVQDISEDRLLDVLDEALGARVIEEMPEAVGHYQFTHALMQETLVDELSLTRRVRLHSRIATALEELYGDNAEAHAAELAHHFAQAEAVLGSEKLVHYSLLAGEKSLEARAYEQALTHFQLGLTSKGVALDSSEKTADIEAAALLSGLGQAQLGTLDRQGREEGVISLTRAFNYYIESGFTQRAVDIAAYYLPINFGRDLIERALESVTPDSHDAGRLLSRYITPLRADYDKAQEAFRQALSIAREQGDHALEMRALVDVGCVEFTNCLFESSLERNRAAIELAKRVDQPAEESHARYDLAHVLLAVGDLEEAAQHASAIVEPAQRSGTRQWQVSAMDINENISRSRGDWQAARDFSEKGLATSRQDAVLLACRSVLEYQTGDFEAGEEYLERLLNTVGWDPSASSTPRAFLPHIATPAIVIPITAYIAGSGNKLEVAEAIARSVEGSAFAHPGPLHGVHIGQAFTVVLRNDISSARRLYDSLAPISGIVWPQCPVGPGVSTDRVIGLLAHTMGEPEQAIGHFEAAMDFCRKAGYRPELAWTCCDYADALGSRDAYGDQVRAVSLLDESLAISSELGMRPLMERVLSRREILRA